MEKTFDSQNFDQEVLQSSIPVLVDFFAEWCGPCKMMEPVLHELAEQYNGKVKIGKLNVEEASDIAQKFGIVSLPSFRFFKDGEIVQELNGSQTKEEMMEKLDSLI